MKWTEDVDDLLAAMPDVVVEVIGGVDPVGGWVRRALEQGAAVVTANKVLLAAHGPELLHLAATRGTQLRFEAAVGGGVPLIHGVREGLAGDSLRRVAGILNGTSNYVLSRMAASRRGMAPVLEDARKLGYAEADPSADIDGDDAGAKLVVLGGNRVPSAPAPVGHPEALHSADSARPTSATHAPRLHDPPDCDGRGDGRRLSRVCRSGAGPVRLQLRPERRRQQRRHDLRPVRRAKAASAARAPAGPRRRSPSCRTSWRWRAARNGEHAEQWLPGTVVPPPPRPYYLRFVVRDRPGILASIAAALARQDINLDAVLQEPGYPKDALPFVITVEACEEAALPAAVRGHRAG